MVLFLLICEIVTFICLILVYVSANKTEKNYEKEYSELYERYHLLFQTHERTLRELELEKQLKSNKIDTLAKTEKVSKPRGRKLANKK